LRQSGRGAWLAALVAGATPGLGAEPARATTSINQFNAALYKTEAGADTNLVYSPFSVSTVLAMAYAGANGNTASQIGAVLHLLGNREAIHADWHGLLGKLEIPPGQGEDRLAVANALWPQSDAPILASYLTIVHDRYGAEARTVDYRRKTEEARSEINQWVADQTAQKITDLLKPGTLTSDTRLVLTNAIYFKGTWATPFRAPETALAPFTLLSGKTADRPMMRLTATQGYFENDQLQVLELAYRDKRLSMVIVLPRQKDGLRSLEPLLTAENLTAWTKSLSGQSVIIRLPKFKMESSLSLQKTLEQLGMTDAFTDRADFSGINGQRNLSITAVLHRALVDVNEEGTEAAAATGAVIGITSARIGEPLRFTADHPFFFFIRDRQTGTILFAGRVTDPKG
jgi:serpin B